MISAAWDTNYESTQTCAVSGCHQHDVRGNETTAGDAGIGNALGFVRMVRRATLQLASTQRQLCPAARHMQPLAPAFQGISIAPETQAAVSVLDELIQSHADLPAAGAAALALPAH